jgi:hypothetical protein
MTPTQKAKLSEEDLPVGGAPPVEIPRLDQGLARPVSKEVTDQMPQRIRRSGDEIKQDFQTAMRVMKEGNLMAPQNKPEDAQELQDTGPSAPPPPTAPLPADPDSEEGPLVGDLREFPWEAYNEAIQGDFNREDIKEAIESKLTPIRTNDIILYESVEQHHVIIPGTLEVTLRSLTAGEDLFVKEELYKLEGSNRYVLDNLILLSLTCALKVYNGATLPDHMVTQGADKAVDVDRFREKLAVLKKQPLAVISLLSVVNNWFDLRVRNQIVKEILGN